MIDHIKLNCFLLIRIFRGFALLFKLSEDPDQDEELTNHDLILYFDCYLILS